MSQYRKILIIADPGMRITTALRRGVALAERTGAELHLAVFDHSTSLLRARFLDPVTMKSAIQEYLGKWRDWLQGLQQGYEKQGITTHVSAIWGAPVYEEIVRFVLEHEPDLVIKDVHAEKRMTKLLFTPMDWNLLRHCPSKLMLVNPHASTYPKKIVAAVDPLHLHNKPHELNDRIVRSAQIMAYQCDATLDVVHAYEYLASNIPMGMGAVLARVQVFEENHTKHATAFKRFGEEHSIPADKIHLLEGQPEVVLTDYVAETHTDLLVMGSVHRTGLEQVFIGSTAERILDRVACDILVMKPDGFRNDLEKELAPRKPVSDEPEPWKDFRRYSL